MTDKAVIKQIVKVARAKLPREKVPIGKCPWASREQPIRPFWAPLGRHANMYMKKVV
jgi:hypothetical protein